MKKNGKLLLFIYVAGIIVLHLIPTGSVMPDANSFEINVEPDYLVHILLFLPWMTAGFVVGKKKSRKRIDFFKWHWLLLGLAVAAGAETLQYFIDYRVFNPVDLVLNVSGVLIGWYPAKLIVAKK